MRALVLGIFDRSFPCDAECDTGCGSPYGREGLRFVEFVRQLGFDGIQLGPQGDGDPGNPSPYDGSSAARGIVALSLGELTGPAWGRLLSAATLERQVLGRSTRDGDRVEYTHAHAAHRAALREAFESFRARAGAAELRPLTRRFESFAAEQALWLEADALYQVLREIHAGAEWPHWPDPLDQRLLCPGAEQAAAAARRRQALEREYAGELAFARFTQFVAHAQHARLRETARAAELVLYGDLPVGLSPRDAWPQRARIWEAYRLGAPPSRTNPEGQPWGYPVLDPAQPEAVLASVRARFRKVFAEYDGARLDHPHGYVCPWVYDACDPRPDLAVQRGARLFSSPALPDHPLLARFAIARADQLKPEPATPRYADDWVVRLDDEQVARYGAQIDAILDVAREHGRGPEHLVCEVLSTLPHPLARVLARHGLGRFRVTQKADPRDPRDVYRSENAAPADWIMLGNHDTPTIWGLAGSWSRDAVADRAEYLAGRLAAAPARRRALAERLRADPRWLAQAHFADLFLGPARHALIFFGDVFGLHAPYNRPGVFSADNWSQRLPRSWREDYTQRAAELSALNLPLALSLALRAGPAAEQDAALIERLEARSGAATPERSR